MPINGPYDEMYRRGLDEGKIRHYWRGWLHAALLIFLLSLMHIIVWRF